MKTFSLLVVISVSTIVFFQNCGQMDAEHTVSQQLLNQIHAKVMSAVKLSCQSDTDCAQIPMGSRICGGPQLYLVYSELESNSGELVNLVESYTQYEEVYNSQQKGVSGTCDVAEPYSKLVCESNVCKGEEGF